MLVTTAVAVCAAALLAACGGSNTTNDASGGGTPAAGTESSGGASATMTISRANDPSSFDPAQEVSTGGGLETLTAFYDRLIDLDAKGELKPALATSWETSQDGKTVTLKLRDDATFHDGSKFDASEVRYTWQRITGMKAPAAQYWTNVDDVVVVDPTTVEFKLKKPSPTFLPTLAGQRGIYMGPSKACVEAHEKKKGDWAKDYFTGHECGTGPYTLGKWDHDQQITFEAYEDHWRGWEGNHVKSFVQKVVKEPSTAQLLLTQGELDLAADNLPTQVLTQLESDPNVKVDSSETTTIDQITFNPDAGPLKDVRVRRAIAMLFDYDAAITQAYKGNATRVSAGLPSTVEPALPDGAPTFERDVDGAKKLLAEAGYADGLKLKFVAADLNQWKNLGLILQSSLAEANIDVEVEMSTWPVLFAKLGKPKGKKPFDMAGYQMWAAIPDASDILLWWSTDAISVINPGWGDETTDKWIADAGTELDEGKRTERYQQLLAKLNEDVAGIWVDQPKSQTAMRKDVQGFVYNPYYNGLLNFYALSKNA